MFRNPFARSYTVNCPDGPRTVYKDVNDVFPLHLTHTKGAANATVKGLEHIQAQAGFSSEERVSAVLVRIDQLNQSMQAQFRATYAVYQASPCTELPYFRSAVEKIIVDEQKLRSVQTIIEQMNAMIAKRPKGTPLDPRAVELIDAQLGRAITALLPEPERLMLAKMTQVSQITEEWKGHD